MQHCNHWSVLQQSKFEDSVLYYFTVCTLRDECSEPSEMSWVVKN